MINKKAYELLENGILKKSVRVKMSGLTGFENFTEIENAYVKKARLGEFEDDWVVVIINGQIYDSSYIDEIEGYGITK